MNSTPPRLPSCNPTNGSAVTTWTVSENQKQLLRFLGFVIFYHRFTRKNSTVTAPLTSLTSSKVTSQWISMAEEAFQTHKAQIIITLISQMPDPTCKFVVEVVASDASWTCFWDFGVVPRGRHPVTACSSVLMLRKIPLTLPRPLSYPPDLSCHHCYHFHLLLLFRLYSSHCDAFLLCQLAIASCLTLRHVFHLDLMVLTLSAMDVSSLSLL